ncbi:MAG: hypothetical protein A2402_01355 [Candidatus Staskawiczbacteria bacterium RIFOXYC1_FULL_37_43]|nr:MAG: hypothetical protein A2813_02850 [Candidatus Staskawiczbacteria bacterium RIFCSPHIGHO2_01_FULL_37_17]OGZ71705.1 MAG: hypothetical protein A2891_00145 [Candidatus Staskawiczbacteria bacterium RIFCSPLOWO2_01_FULL_37_19]OGZ75399.1 MAG: hypothetical protein A2205_01495 [Candidatus Staskawiczbacteria bacterium RIFOXYA1_FULL_37_15]OGZ77992.1 MAG: hypothetical protein A2280_00185 [Candidatus Staskawiczbacteria bacterium RIFOXYA12_FULL_37_10]OGZ80850.1 MAG: hypothetical protein A2353_01260 [Can
MQIDRPITIAVCLFIVLLLIFFLVVPQYNVFKDLRVELGKKKAEYNAEYEYFSEIAKNYSQIQALEQDIEKIDDALPIGYNFGNLIYYFQNQALADGMIIKSMFLSKSSSAGAKKTNYSYESESGESKMPQMNEIGFSLNMTGSYSSLENFIVSLEKSARLFEVKNISFGASAASQGAEQSQQFQMQEIYNFNLEVLTHSY